MVKEGKQRVIVTLPKKTVEFMDETIKCLNKRGDQSIEWSRSRLINFALNSLWREFTQQNNEKSKED